MNEPIPISRDDPLISADDYLRLEKAKNERRMGWALMGLFGAVVLAFLIPLTAWLTRLALGG